MRIAEDASFSDDQRQALLASRYTTLIAPTVVLLEKQLRATAAHAPATPHERSFAARFLPRLRAAAQALREGTGVTDWARPQAAWAPLRAAAAALARQQRQPLPPLAELSPLLATMSDTQVPMPGYLDDGTGGLYGSAGGGCGGAGFGEAGVTVASVGGEVVALPTKTRPKRISLVGSDGSRHTYLLKGREDLRMDERLMQVGTWH